MFKPLSPPCLNLSRGALAALCLNLNFKKFLKFFKNLRRAEFTDRLFKFKIRAIFLIGGMVKARITLLNLDRRKASNSLAARLFMWF